MRIVRDIFFFFLISILAVNLSFAQQYNFKNYTVKNGLAGSTVTNVFQDSKGYLWFGTDGGGVSRFDGKEFENFAKKDGLIANYITFISEDRIGNIWIATIEGVSKFDGLKFTNYSKKEGLSDGGVYWIYADENNKIWFAVRGGGVSVYDGSTFKSYTTKNGLSSNEVYSIVQDKNGDYWFGLEDGISKFEGDKITNFNKGKYFENKVFFSSLVDSNGNIWFGSTTGSILKYNGEKFESIQLPSEVENDFIGSIAEDKKGNIWFATDHGLLKYEGSQFSLFTEKQGLSSSAILSLGIDYEGNVWIGTVGGGVNLFNNEAFINYTSKDGLTIKSISSIVLENKNNILIGTTGSGVNRYDTKTNLFHLIEGVPEIAQLTVYSLVLDKKNNLWIGAQEGVYVLEKTEQKYKLKTQFHSIDSLELKTITKIICDKNGAIWCSSYFSGIFKITDYEQKSFSTKNGFVTNDAYTVFEDKKSQIWIGTKDVGLVKYDGKKFINYGNKDGLLDMSIWSITEDENGIIYLGTGENGLVLFDGKKFKNFNVANGLISNSIVAVQYDKYSKSIWIGTDKGVNKVKFNSKLEIENVRTYQEKEGFKGNEVNQNAIFVDKEGLVWFGSSNGLSAYNRKYDIPNLTPPILHLMDIRMGYQVADWGKLGFTINKNSGLPENLELHHKNNNLTFDFQAFTTDNVKYTFMLEGQDNEWSPLTTNTEANFTNITPGKTYTFKVKAVNSNGIWSKYTVEYSFTINPPWWQTWWFYTIVILVFFITIFWFIKYRTMQLAKEKRILEQKVEIRTNQLKDTNDKLSIAFQDIKDSINYAKRIQEAILPIEQEIKVSFPHSFVFFKPRDVVSGDFYWFNKKDNLIYFAAVDCTGHGVPGAFMSMIGNSLLNEIVNTNAISDAAAILKKLHQEVRKSLKQDREYAESKDGMDIALVVVDAQNKKLQYAGAKRPLYFFRENNFTEIKANKQSIGGIEMEDHYQFTNHVIELQKNDCFYMFTDGYVDQFGGEKGKKYSSKRLKESLSTVQHLSMSEQGIYLKNEIENWHNTIEQVDDILVIGIQL